MITKFRGVVVCFLVLLLLVNVASFSLPLVNGAGGGLVVDKAFWLKLASNAWQYFQPGVGVNSVTGLHCSGVDYPFFTGWDVGVYLTAIMDAQELGLVSKSGSWGSDDRINKVLSWLQTCALTSDDVPYTWYETNSGRPAFGNNTEGINIYDYGHLLIALHRLQSYRPDLADEIGNLVNVRFNSSFVASQIKPTYFPYEYYIAHGFEYFGYNTSGVFGSLNLLRDLVNQSHVSVCGVELPKTSINCEPLLLGMFSFDSDPFLADLSYRVYLANEGRYNVTGNFTAFSEGNTDLPDPNPSYVYEWVVTSSGAWVVSPVPIIPIAYLKVAVSFLALYDTGYARDMVSVFEPKLLKSGFLFTPAKGYMDGVDENGRIVTTVTDKTNGLIISAARYALENNFNPTPSPTPSATLTPSFTPAPTLPAASASVPSPSISTVTPSLVPSPSSSGYFSPVPLATVTPLSAPSFLLSPSPSLGPVVDLPGRWAVELVLLVVLVFVGCLVVFWLFVVRNKRFNLGMVRRTAPK